jgi:uncharacterized protein YbaR (Trm112 family)
MPSLSLACPHCRQTLSVDGPLSDQAVACPKCGKRFLAPTDNAALDLDLLAEQSRSAPILSSVRLPTTRKAKAAVRGRRYRAWLLVLLSSVGMLSLLVAGVLIAMRLVNRAPAEPDYEASARAALAAALDKWLTGDDSDAWHWDAIQAVLLDYDIHALRHVKTELFDLPSEEWAKYEGPTAVYTDRPLTYLATVHASLKSQAGTPLPRVLLYRLTWLRDTKRWNIEAKGAPG